MDSTTPRPGSARTDDGSTALMTDGDLEIDAIVAIRPASVHDGTTDDRAF